MQEQSKQSIDLVGITLTELLIVLLFILLVLFTSLLADSDKEVEKRKVEAEQLDQRLSEVAQLFDLDQSGDDFFSRLVEQKQLAMMVAEDGELDAELIAEQLALQRELAEILGVDNSKPALLEKARNISKQLTLSEQTNEELREEVDNRTGQLIRIQKTLTKNGGRGIPPCWVDQKGKVEYVYRILIDNNLVAVEAGYPDHREDNFLELPESRMVLEKRVMSVSTFNSLTRGIYDWSAEQEPECRHYIEIFDQSSDASQLRVNIKRVQNNFYPSLMTRTKPPETLRSLFGKQHESLDKSRKTIHVPQSIEVPVTTSEIQKAATEHEPLSDESPPDRSEKLQPTSEKALCGRVSRRKLRQIAIGDSQAKVERLIGRPCRSGQSPAGNAVWLYSEDNDRAFVVFQRGIVIAVSAKP